MAIKKSIKLMPLNWQAYRPHNERYAAFETKDYQRMIDLWITYIMGEMLDAGIPIENCRLSYNGEVKGMRYDDPIMYQGVSWEDFDADVHIPKIDRTRKVLANESGKVWLTGGGSSRKMQDIIRLARTLGLTYTNAGAASLGSKKQTFVIPFEDVMLWLDHVPTMTIHSWYQKNLKSN